MYFILDNSENFENVDEVPNKLTCTAYTRTYKKVIKTHGGIYSPIIIS